MARSTDTNRRVAKSALILAESYFPASRAGGPIRSISRIVEQEGRNWQLRVITRDREIGSNRAFSCVTPNVWMKVGRADILYSDCWLPRLVRQYWGASRKRAIDVLYLNSLFSPLFSIVPLVLWRLGVLKARVLLVAPRGELGMYALGLKAWKKRPVLAVLLRMLNSRRVVWQATGTRERDDILRVAGESSEVIVNGGNISPPPASIAPQITKDELSLVYLARVVPIKNLLHAIDSLKLVNSPVEFTIVGGIGDREYSRQCRSALQGLPDNVVVREMGHVNVEEVQAILHKSHGLLLPTRGENFGHSIAESLASGCFVLIPDTTPWTRLVEEGGGMIIAKDDPEITAAVLNKLARMEKHEWNDLRERAHARYLEFWEGTKVGSSSSILNEALLAAYKRCGSPL